ncbi:MAG: CPBP family glutamic-type intramembrane protease [Pyrinomonadaceae bacterium]
MLGIASFLFVDLHALIAAIPLPPGESPPELPPPALLKLVSVIQPAAITTLAVAVGCWLAGKVGLHSPAAEAAANGEPILAKLKPQILPGVIAGLATGVALVVIWIIARPFFSAEFITRAEDFNRFMPAITRFLYGGFTEELLLRWGVMTFLVWAAWRLFQRLPPPRQTKRLPPLLRQEGSQELPGSGWFVAAIVVSALVFGIGHLPIASMLAGGLTLPIVIYVITGNSIFGVAAGFLYWKKGLEAAIIAHITAHVVLVSAIYLSF